MVSGVQLIHRRLNMKHLLVLSVFVLSANAFALDAKLKEAALKMVPNGTVVSESHDEVKIKGANGIIEVEFEKDGDFEEASGKNALLDEFVPGDKSLPLKEVVEKLTKEGITLTGEWSYEHSLLKGWYYELDGVQGGVNKEFTVDAKTGKILKAEIDD